MVLIYENLRVLDYLQVILRGWSCYYASLSGGARLLDAMAHRFGIFGAQRDRVREFGWGDTEYVGHSIRDAAHASRQQLPALSGAWEGMGSSGENEFDLPFLLKKFILVEVLYRKYFFYELLLQFRREFPDRQIRLHAELDNSKPYAERLTSSGLQLIWRAGPRWLSTLAAISFLPMLLPLYWRRKIEPTAGAPVAGVVCNVENPSMLDGYRHLLRPEIEPTFVTAPEYQNSMAASLGIAGDYVSLGLSAAFYSELSGLLERYANAMRGNLRGCAFLGWDVLRFANKLVHGRIRAPAGSNYQLLTCEHHDLTKTIRNEFIRNQGATSVLFPYSSLYVLRFYPDEYYENYDYVMSPGPHYEDVLSENEARCQQVIPSGTYLIHKNGLGDTLGRVQQLQALRAFVGSNRVVTILCPGVCKPTYPSEIKLMQLAVSLSEIEGVKVIVRQKPFTPEPQYQGFYEGFADGKDSLLLTGMEYDLFDFLPVTDLFVTSYSTSACELAVCGGNVLFVDFLDQDDRFIFWRKEVVGELLVDGAQASARILDVLEQIDNTVGTYRRDLARFVEYIGYRHDGYAAYRANLMGLLQNRLGIKPAGASF
jgi:hypothetical protein